MSTNNMEFYRAQPALDFIFLNGAQSYNWIGIISIVTLILLPLVFRSLSQEQKKFIAVSLALTCIALVMMTKLFPWDKLPDSLAIIQFPWRLSIISVLFLSCASGMVYYHLFKSHIKLKDDAKYWAVAVSASLALIGAIMIENHFSNNRIDAYERVKNTQSMRVSSGLNDYLPNNVSNYADRSITQPELDGIAPWTWNGYDFNIVRSPDPLALSGVAEFSHYKKSGSHMSMRASVEEAAIIELPVIYYPGYQVYVGDKNLITFGSENGFAAFRLSEPGEYDIRAHYGMSRGTQAGAVMTLITISALGGYFVMRRKTGSPA